LIWRYGGRRHDASGSALGQRDATKYQQQTRAVVPRKLLTENDHRKRSTEHGHQIDEEPGTIATDQFDTARIGDLTENGRKDHHIDERKPALEPRHRPPTLLLRQLPGRERQRHQERSERDCQHVGQPVDRRSPAQAEGIPRVEHTAKQHERITPIELTVQQVEWTPAGRRDDNTCDREGETEQLQRSHTLREDDEVRDHDEQGHGSLLDTDVDGRCVVERQEHQQIESAHANATEQEQQR